MDMNLYGDYHTHTQYSHGIGSVMANAHVAKAKGLRAVAITDHGFRHLLYNMKRSEMGRLRKDADEAEKETGVRVLVGVESNLIGSDGSVDIKEKDIENLDIVLCGFHKMAVPRRFSDWWSYARVNIDDAFGRSSRRMLERNTNIYLRALDRYPIDVITHINYGITADVRRVAEKCAEVGTYIELNGKRINFSREEFLSMLETPVKFIVNSDAHSPDRVGDVSVAEKFLKGIDVPPERIVNIGAEAPIFRSRKHEN